VASANSRRSEPQPPAQWRATFATAADLGRSFLAPGRNSGRRSRRSAFRRRTNSNWSFQASWRQTFDDHKHRSPDGAKRNPGHLMAGEVICGVSRTRCSVLHDAPQSWDPRLGSEPPHWQAGLWLRSASRHSLRAAPRRGKENNERIVLCLHSGQQTKRDPVCRRYQQPRAPSGGAQGKARPGFTRKYNVDQLVYFEAFDSILEARAREHTLKRWRRSWKIELIEKFNPDWRDLANELTL
jgi:hypothetical protein